MANNVRIDDAKVKANLTKFATDFTNKIGKAVGEVAEEIMRLSQFEVPHDTGELQNSGVVQEEKKREWIVGYNKVYAARLHEHPEYRFRKGRKGKYLEDPIRVNLDVFRNHIGNNIKI